MRDEQDRWLRDRNHLHNEFHDILRGQSSAPSELLSSVDDEINELYKHFSIASHPVDTGRAARGPLTELDASLPVGTSRLPLTHRSFSPVVTPAVTYQDDDEEDEDIRRAIEESLKFK